MSLAHRIEMSLHASCWGSSQNRKCFFDNDPATTETCPLTLHAGLPILWMARMDGWSMHLAMDILDAAYSPSVGKR